MNVRDVLTLCATLVVGGVFIAGSANANALSSPYEMMSVMGNSYEDARENALFDRSLGNTHEDARENALFDRSIEKANKGNKVDKAAKHDRKAASLANQGYSAGGLQPAQSSLTNYSSSAAVAVPEPSTLMLLGSVLLGFATWHFRQRKSVAVLHHTGI